MGGRAQKKSEQANYDRQKNFIYNALAQLSPQNIQQLMQMFLPHIVAQQSALGQTAISGLKRNQALRGLSQSPVSASQELGLRSAQGNQALQQAFAQAFGLAQQRAGVWGQQPMQTQPNYNMTNALQTGIQQSLLAAALQGRGQQQQGPWPIYPPTGGGWNSPHNPWGAPMGGVLY